MKEGTDRAISVLDDDKFPGRDLEKRWKVEFMEGTALQELTWMDGKLYIRR